MRRKREKRRFRKMTVMAAALALAVMAETGSAKAEAATGEPSITWKTVSQGINSSNEYVYDGEKTDATLSNRLLKQAGSLWGLITDGKVDTGYTGVAANLNGWFKVESGWVDFTESGITKAASVTVPLSTWDSSWYSFSDGKVQISDNDTVIHNENGWWYITDGAVDFSYNGFAQNGNGAWHITGGRVTFDDYGVFKDENNALGNGTGERYLVIDSMVQEGMEYDVVRVSGSSNNTDGWWYVSNGKVVKGVTVAKNVNGWWYINEEGKVDFSFNGAASNSNGTWYISNGKVDFTFNGTAYGYTFVNGKAQ